MEHGTYPTHWFYSLLVGTHWRVGARSLITTLGDCVCPVCFKIIGWGIGRWWSIGLTAFQSCFLRADCAVFGRNVKLFSCNCHVWRWSPLFWSHFFESLPKENWPWMIFDKLNWINNAHFCFWRCFFGFSSTLTWHHCLFLIDGELSFVSKNHCEWSVCSEISNGQLACQTCCDHFVAFMFSVKQQMAPELNAWCWVVAPGRNQQQWQLVAFFKQTKKRKIVSTSVSRFLQWLGRAGGPEPSLKLCCISASNFWCVRIQIFCKTPNGSGNPTIIFCFVLFCSKKERKMFVTLFRVLFKYTNCT